MSQIFFQTEVVEELTVPLEPPESELYIDPTMLPNGNLKTLLTDINNVDSKLLKGKIAEYAGFYFDSTETLMYDSLSDNSNNPDVDASFTSQTNKSIDKLTFYIMFRLPFLKRNRIEIQTIGSIPKGNFCSSSFNLRTIQQDLTDQSLFIEVMVTQTINKKKIRKKKKFPLSNPDNVSDVIGKILYYDSFNDTFYVNPYESFYGDPLNSSSVFGTSSNVQSWSFRANEIRSSISNLKKLNSKAEQVMQVGTSWLPVDDSGNDLSGFFNKEAYKFYALVNETNTTTTSWFITGTNSQQQIINLFDHTASTQDEIDFKKIPLHFFLIAMDENPYSIWLKQSSSSLHHPDGFKYPDYYKQKVKILGKKVPNTNSYTSITLNQISGIDGKKIIISTIPGKYEISNGTDSFILEKDNSCDTLSYVNKILVKRKDLFLSDGDYDYYVEDDSKIVSMKDENKRGKSFNSGITIGFGVDMGTSFNKNFYKLQFTITASTANFKLLYLWRQSSDLNSTTTAAVMQSELKNITGSESIQVTKAGNVFTVELEHTSYSLLGEDHRKHIYTHEYLKSCPAVLISATTKIPKAINSFNDFINLMNRCFRYYNTNTIITSDDWLNDGGVPLADQNSFKEKIKEALSLTQYPASKFLNDNESLLKKFNLKYIDCLRGIYKYKYIGSNYYSNGITEIFTMYEPLLNQIELYVIMSSVWWSSQIDPVKLVLDDARLAVISHNQEILLKYIIKRKFPDAKRERLKGILGQNVDADFAITNAAIIKNLFRNVSSE